MRPGKVKPETSAVQPWPWAVCIEASTLNPTIVRVLTRLGAGGPPIHAVTLTRELSKFGYSSILVTGSKDPQDGDMSYLLREDDPVHSIPEMSRSVSLWQDLRAL